MVPEMRRSFTQQEERQARMNVHTLQGNPDRVQTGVAMWRGLSETWPDTHRVTEKSVLALTMVGRKSMHLFPLLTITSASVTRLSGVPWRRSDLSVRPHDRNYVAERACHVGGDSAFRLPGHEGGRGGCRRFGAHGQFATDAVAPVQEGAARLHQTGEPLTAGGSTDS